MSFYVTLFFVNVKAFYIEKKFQYIDLIGMVTKSNTYCVYWGKM